MCSRCGPHRRSVPSLRAVKRSSLLLILAIAVVATLAAVVLRRNETHPAALPPPDTTTTTAVTEVPEPTTTIATTTTASTTTLPDGPLCDLYGPVETIGAVTTDSLAETSGIAASRRSDGVIWAHNDSGDDATLYAIDTDGMLLGSFNLGLGLAFDWEDLAIGPGPAGDGSYLYVGDIGDNFAIREGTITVYVVPEPEPGATAAVESVYELRTGDGPHDFEALFVADGTVYAATKEPTTRVYRADLAAGTLDLIAEVDLGATVTAADISWEGSIIAFRGYEEVWLWRRHDGETVAEALAREPCTVASPDEEQGEGLAFLADGAIVTVSEGEHPEINMIPRP